MSAPKPRPARPQDGAAWVTGASSGIGWALTKRLVAEGWTVAVSARSADKLEQLQAETDGRARAYPVDQGDADAVVAAIEKIENELGPVALAVLNAGVYLPVNAEAPVLDAFRKTFDVNLLGTAAALSALNPRMCARRSGQIAIVSSATGFGGMPTCSAYGASKAALINMAECCKLELDRWGVKMQVVTPGFVETPAQDDNEFPKPFMVSADTAAKRIVTGLKKRGFEITFPKIFTWQLKFLYGLPKGWYLPLVKRQTGENEPVAPDATPSPE